MCSLASTRLGFFISIVGGLVLYRVLLLAYHPVAKHLLRLRPQVNSRIVEGCYGAQRRDISRSWDPVQSILLQCGADLHRRSLKGRLPHKLPSLSSHLDHRNKKPSITCSSHFKRIFLKSLRMASRPVTCIKRLWPTSKTRTQRSRRTSSRTSASGYYGFSVA